MVVLHIQSSSDTIGGQELSLFARLKVLRRHQIDNIVALPGPGKFTDLLTENGFTVIFIPVQFFSKKTVVKYIQAVALLLIAVARYKVKLIHCQGLYPAQLAIPVSKLYKIKTIININNVNYVAYDYRRSFAKYADLIIGNSNACVDNILGNVEIDANKVLKVYSAIIDSDIIVEKVIINDLKSKYAINEDTIVVGQISQLIPIKGIEYFVRMAKIVKERHGDVKFILVGAVTQGYDAYFAEIKTLVSELGLDKDIIFAGYQHDIYPYISIIDISVLCSLYEGLSRVLVESMLMRVPCVATNAGGSSEVVSDDLTGFVVPLKDPDAMADRVSFLIKNSDVRSRLGTTARDFVYNQFSYENHFTHLAEAYQRCNITLSST